MEVVGEEEVQSEGVSGMNAEALKALQEENFTFINKQKTPNTVRKTCWEVEIFLEFLKDKGETRKT